MKRNNNDDLVILVESNLTLFDLKLKAAQIKNGYLIKNTLNRLVNFVDGSNGLRFSNP